VPIAIGTHPFQQIPFQWSVHVEEKDGEINHEEFLAIETFGDFGVMAREFISVIPASGPIFAYNANFERRMLMYLAASVPSHSMYLHCLAQRLVDLLPITREAYYHRDMRGSWSIKSVIPTIDARLSYDYLDGVQEGDGAQLAFLELQDKSTTPERGNRKKCWYRAAGSVRR
jgi:hypothetical protein